MVKKTTNPVKKKVEIKAKTEVKQEESDAAIKKILNQIGATAAAEKEHKKTDDLTTVQARFIKALTNSMKSYFKVYCKMQSMHPTQLDAVEKYHGFLLSQFETASNFLSIILNIYSFDLKHLGDLDETSLKEGD